MQEALTILNEVGHEFGLSAEIAHMITHIRHYERLTGECSGVGTILDWMETAVKDLSELANVFHPSSQTAEHFRHEAARLRYYVGRLRALGFLPTSPLAIHERPPLMGVGIDQGKAAHVSHRPARQARRALPRRPLGRPLMGCQMDGDRMPHGMLTSAEDMDRLRQVNAYKERIPVTREWLMAEASRELEGHAHAVRGGASDAIVLKEAADVGNLCQMIGERYIMP